MSIVRSLLISIGFQTDKKAINETNRAITGFKTRFAIAATAATYAFKAVKEFFTQIASATLDSEEMARSLGLSLNEFEAIKQAAAGFRINDTQITQVLATLQKDQREFLQGFGRLPEILRKLKIEMNKGDSPLVLFDKIVERLREIEDVSTRDKVADELFPGLGVKLSNLAGDYDKFREAVNKAYEELKKAPDITPQLKAYEAAVDSLGVAFDRLVKQIGVYVFPALEKVFNYLEYVSRFWGTLFTGDFEGFKGVLNEGSKKIDEISDAFANKVNSVIDYLNPYVTYDPNAPKSVAPQDYGPSWIESQLPESWVNYINNKVDVNVPQGTSQEQATFLGEQIDRMVEDSIMDTFYKIQNNNPVVE